MLLNETMTKIDRLSEHRLQIDSNSLDGSDAQDYYTGIHAMLPELISFGIRSSPDAEAERLTAAYTALLEGKETAGQEPRPRR